jgi:outer membrane lipoprotein-sorting protein
MKFLRTVSTRRLLALIAGVVVIIVGGTAIALAATSGGPVPARSTLAKAVHRAVTAPAVTGISARISFTNHLIDASDLQGTDPILQGASGRLWVSDTGQLRLELQGDNGDGQVVVNNRSFFIYDPAMNSAYEGTFPADSHRAAQDTQQGPPTVAQIQTNLNRLMQRVNVSGAIPSDVAGRPAYTVRVSPKHDGGLLGDAQLAWDAIHGVPLRFAIYARGDGSPVLELKVTHITYGKVSSSVFRISPPRGAKITKIAPATTASAAKGTHKPGQGQKPVTGVAAVASHVPFKLVAPPKLVGLPRQSVQLLDMSGSSAALVTYGQNLGGIAVIEAPAKPGAHQAAASSDNAGPGLSLPTISIHGTTGTELDTALGTVVTFTRKGVSYTVIGSVPAVAAEAAARAL